jgi:hypothetical protein
MGIRGALVPPREEYTTTGRDARYSLLLFSIYLNPVQTTAANRLFI